MLKIFAWLIAIVLVLGGLFGVIPWSVFQQPLMIIALIILILVAIFG